MITMNYENENFQHELGSKWKLHKMKNFKGDDEKALRDDDEIIFSAAYDEEFSPSTPARRNSWNSLTFDSEDFIGGVAQA